MDILYLREDGCEDPCLFFEAKGGSRAENFWENTHRGVVGCGFLRPLYCLLRTGHRPILTVGILVSLLVWIELCLVVVVPSGLDRPCASRFRTA